MMRIRTLESSLSRLPRRRKCRARAQPAQRSSSSPESELEQLRRENEELRQRLRKMGRRRDVQSAVPLGTRPSMNAASAEVAHARSQTPSHGDAPPRATAPAPEPSSATSASASVRAPESRDRDGIGTSTNAATLARPMVGDAGAAPPSDQLRAADSAQAAAVSVPASEPALQAPTQDSGGNAKQRSSASNGSQSGGALGSPLHVDGSQLPVERSGQGMPLPTSPGSFGSDEGDSSAKAAADREAASAAGTGSSAEDASTNGRVPPREATAGRSGADDSARGADAAWKPAREPHISYVPRDARTAAPHGGAGSEWLPSQGTGSPPWPPAAEPDAAASRTPRPLLRRTLSLARAAAEMEELTLDHPSESLKALQQRVASGAQASASDASDAEGASGARRGVAQWKGALKKRMSLVFVASEAAPYSKSGGLGDVVGSLPGALARRGHRVMVITPRYLTGERDREAADRLHDCCTWLTLHLGNGEHAVNFHHEARDGVDWVYVEHMSFQREGGLYGNDGGIYEDNMFRYTMLSMAACEAALQLVLPDNCSKYSKWLDSRRGSSGIARLDAARFPDALPADVKIPCSAYGENVAFVANDWHAGMVPVYIKHKYQPHDVFTDAYTVYTIHNLAHQGTALARDSSLLAVPDAYQDLEWIYEETDGRRTPVVNIMKAAIINADRVLTVSESYAAEIMTPSQGVGLETVLQASCDRLNGIVNGMDTRTWDPSKDPHLSATYSQSDLRGKAVCKRALLRRLGLPEPEYGVTVPLLGFIGRLDPQKGPDVILEALPSLLAMDCQVVMLGSGHPVLEQALSEAEAQHPDFFRSIVTFDEALAHQIVAASDILLMPSRFEPCGLNQMHAMRYGTVPIAAATGGLKDTVVDVSPFAQGDGSLGTGWLFSPPTPRALATAVRAAVRVYQNDAKQWERIQRAGMASDFSWAHAAEAYEAVLMARDQRGRGVLA